LRGTIRICEGGRRWAGKKKEGMEVGREGVRMERRDDEEEGGVEKLGIGW
jgi:hypothetical protein